MLLASGIAGYIEPESSILMGIAVVSLQPIALFISVKELGPLAVIGLMYFGVFAVLCTGSAFIGAYIRKGPMF